MAGILDPRLLVEFELTGPAVERDRSVKDNNNAGKTIEQEWIEAGRRLDAEISASEVEFFEEMRRRQNI